MCHGPTSGLRTRERERRTGSMSTSCCRSAGPEKCARRSSTPGAGSDTNLGCYGYNANQLPILVTAPLDVYDEPTISAGMSFTSSNLTGFAVDTLDPDDPRAAYLISFQDLDGFVTFTDLASARRARGRSTRSCRRLLPGRHACA